MKKYLQMFWSFIKIGAFTLGGGYAMIPLIEKEIVERRKWIEHKEFIDMIAISQSAPGSIAVNTAAFVGYKVGGFPGSIMTTLGAIMPSYIIIILVASVFIGIQDSTAVKSIFKGIDPAITALIAAPVLRLGKDARINKKTIAIPIVAAVLVAFLKITPILIIIVSAIGGIALNTYEGRKMHGIN